MGISLCVEISQSNIRRRVVLADLIETDIKIACAGSIFGHHATLKTSTTSLYILTLQTTLLYIASIHGR